MGIIQALNIHPGEEMTWEQYHATAPPRSIALDGYVTDLTVYDFEAAIGNINHHGGADRSSMNSTATQASDLIKLTRLTAFHHNGKPSVILDVNDPDQDVCLATWIFDHGERIMGNKSEPLLNRLLYIQNKLDVYAGAWPESLESNLMRDVAWIFEPYTDVRNKVTAMTAGDMRNVIESVWGRINQYTLGQGKQLTPDGSYKILADEPGSLPLLQEIGPYARVGISLQGMQAFISYRGQTPTGNYVYSVWKAFGSPVPLTWLYTYWNKIEGIAEGVLPRWDGADTTGGSPRRIGSKMPPAQMVTYTAEGLKEYRALHGQR
ncbi:hypothetical protein HZB02_03005 [Candidatus Woesearchaeota archaeon]|nr:hypothetical protein [Candidatus Woesearchaeota archaeon]